MKSSKKRLLIMVDWFEPGFKAGGPIRSVVNVVAALKGIYEVFVLTGDKDLGDDVQYAGVTIDSWNSINGYAVFYASALNRTRKSVLTVIREVNADFIYLNSMYSAVFSLYPLFFKWLGLIEGQIVLAPRGMLKESALGQKRIKKTIFLKSVRILGLHRKVTFQATDNQEVFDVRKWFGLGSTVAIIPNLPGRLAEFELPPAKEAGALKIVFVGRIHPIKKLDLLLRALSEQNAIIELTVVAPIEDAGYWRTCDELIGSLPPNVSVRHLEHIPHNKVESIIRNNHIFALPTAGENFGHAIFEALSVGRPVLISDQTPWRNLEAAKAGWDLDIQTPAAFSAKLRMVAGFNEVELKEWCMGAREFCSRYLERSDAVQQYFKLFS